MLNFEMLAVLMSTSVERLLRNAECGNHYHALTTFCAQMLLTCTEGVDF